MAVQEYWAFSSPSVELIQKFPVGSVVVTTPVHMARLDIFGQGREGNSRMLSSLLVGAIGFESTLKRSFNKMQVSG
jgi:hypothetical protein